MLRFACSLALGFVIMWMFFIREEDIHLLPLAALAWFLVTLWLFSFKRVSIKDRKNPSE